MSDACRQTSRSDAEPADRALVRDVLWETYSDVSVQVHAFTPDELHEALDYVPAHLRDGSYLLVSTSMHSPSAIDGSARVSFSAGEFKDCCDVEDWLTLDDREDELERLRRAEREEAAAQERNSGPLGVVRRLAEYAGGFAAGLGSDLMYVGTLGAIDVDVSRFEGSVLSPVQLLRSVRLSIPSSDAEGEEDEEREEDTAPTPEEEQEAEGLWRARSAATLAALINHNNELGCQLYPGRSSCQNYNLVKVWAGRRLTVSISMDAPLTEAGAACSFRDSYLLESNGDAAAAINRSFVEPRSLRSFAAHHTLEPR